MIPEYADVIIVGVVYKNNFSWFVTEKELWILDIKKRRDDFINNGYDYPLECILPSRYGYLIINEENIESYLPKIETFKSASNDLKRIILEKLYADTVLSMKPSIFINFDEKWLISNYPETLAFENYVPDNWYSKFCNFDDIIPIKEKYWEDKGRNLINEILKNEIDDFMDDKDE